MSLLPDDVVDLLELMQRQLNGFRALREESARQTDLLREILARLESPERTQYS